MEKARTCFDYTAKDSQPEYLLRLCLLQKLDKHLQIVFYFLYKSHMRTILEDDWLRCGDAARWIVSASTGVASIYCWMYNICMDTEQLMQLLSKLGIPALCSLCCGGLGIVLVALAIARWRKLSASQKWMTVRGQVVKAEIDEIIYNDAEGSSVKYQPHITYTYQAAGQAYNSSGLTVGPQKEYTLKSSAQGVLRRYPVGQQVAVYVNPLKPEEAALERRTPGIGANLILGLLSLLAALCMFTGILYNIYTTFIQPVP
jgi:hypothetical protein